MYRTQNQHSLSPLFLVPDLSAEVRKFLPIKDQKSVRCTNSTQFSMRLTVPVNGVTTTDIEYLEPLNDVILDGSMQNHTDMLAEKLKTSFVNFYNPKLVSDEDILKI